MQSSEDEGKSPNKCGGESTTARKDATQMPNIPPRVPETEADLNRAIQLLDLRTRATLDKGDSAEIKELIGIYPTPAQACAWKQAMKRKMLHFMVLG